MTRQRLRHWARMPIEQVILERIEPVLTSLGEPYIEVQDHDSIQGVMIQVEVRSSATPEDIKRANRLVRSLLEKIVQEHPNDPCIAGWTTSFTKNGSTLARSWPGGAQDEAE